MNSLGWSRRDPDVPVNTAQQTGLLSSIKSLNPFGDGGYVRLPTTEGAGAPLPARTRREEDEAWFACESTFLVSSLWFTYHSPSVSYNHGPFATKHLRWLNLVPNYPELSRRLTLWCIVSRWDRLLIFGGCNIGALACFVIVFALWPIMMAKPKKFAIL